MTVHLPGFLFHASVHDHVSVNIEHVFANLNLFIQETWVVGWHLEEEHVGCTCDENLQNILKEIILL